MIIKLHNWIFFFTMIMTMIEGNYFNSFSLNNIQRYFIMVFGFVVKWHAVNGFVC